MIRPTFANPGANEDKSDYQEIYEQFAEREEPEVHENSINRVKIAGPKKGNSSESGDVMISLRKDTNEIDYIMDELLILECLIDVLPGTTEKNDDYRKYYEQIGECMNPGVHENFVDGFEIAEMTGYNT